MSSYTQFALIYDELQQDVPYDDYADWVRLVAPPTTNKVLVDIGCGTGTMLQRFQALGYEVTGVDLSDEMLMVASERLPHVPLVCQSMDELEGFTDVDVMTIVLDSLNYLPSAVAVQATFERIYASLAAGGHLFFDVHSLLKMDIFLDSPFTYDDGNIAYIWHTEEGDAPHSIVHDMTFFVAEGEHYHRFDETHYQQTYEPAQYVAWLQAAGFTDITVTADFTMDAPTDKSERIFIHAKKAVA